MIRAALRTWLLAQSSVADLIGDRFDLAKVPQVNATYPYVSYRRASGDYEHDLDGGAGLASPIFEIDVWSPKTTEVEAVGQAIRLALQGYRGLMGDVNVVGVELENEEDFFHPADVASDEGRHRTRFRYRIHYET